MTLSLSDDVARCLRAEGQGKAAARTSALLRRAMLAEALDRLPRRGHDDASGTAAADEFADGAADTAA